MPLFNRLTNPKYPRAAVGFESETIAVVRLQSTSKQFVVRRAARVELPEEVLRPGFDTANILDERTLLESLREAATSSGLSGQKRWSVALPAETARIAAVTLEVAPKSGKELQEVLNWKAERTFGAKQTEMRLGFRQLGRLTDDARPRYLATAIKNDVLAEYDELFANLRWHVGLMVPRHLGETQWLLRGAGGGRKQTGDALLISAGGAGFTAVFVRGGEPLVVRTAYCEPEERNDELYRLLLYYRDRLAAENNLNAALQKVLIVGNDFDEAALQQVTEETLGYDVRILTAEAAGLLLPNDEISFDDIAAPAGLASLAWS